MSTINTIFSTNFKGVEFSKSSSTDIDWFKLIEHYNDCGISPFSGSHVNTIFVSWSEFLFYFYDAEEIKDLPIQYDSNILAHIETHKRNLNFVNQLPLPSIESEVENLEEKLYSLGITKRKLFHYQLRDMGRMLSNPSSANFSVPGAGKTFVALCVSAYLNKKILFVFVPNDVVMQSWEHEIRKTFDTDSQPNIFRLDGNLNQIKKSLEALKSGGVGLMTYRKILSRGLETILRNFFINNPTHLILDESHRIKGGIKTSGTPGKIASSILSFSMFLDRKDILSGTPMPLNHNDLISQMEFLYPNVGLRTRIEESAEKPGAPIRGVFVRTTKSELDLPEPTEHFIPQEMSELQAAFYELVVNRYREEFSVPSKRDLMNINIQTKAKLGLTRILRLSVDPFFLANDLKDKKDEIAKYINSSKNETILKNVVNEGKVSKKMQKAIELVEEICRNEEKVIIWSQFSNSIEVLEHELKGFNPVTLYGKTENPEDTVTLFNDATSEVKVLIGNPKKGGEGISLHHNCHNAIYLDRTYNAAEYLQSRDRIHRIGMPSNVEPNYYLIQSVHPNNFKKVIDQRISNNLQRKIENMQELLDDPDLKQLALDESVGEDLSSEYTIEDIDDFLQMLLND